MDMLSFFFLLLSMLFFVRFLNNFQNYKQSNLYLKNNLYFSSLFLGLGLLVNPYLLAFVPGYALMWLADGWKRKKLFLQDGCKDGNKITVKKNRFKILALSLLIIVIITSPILIYNYFIYTKLGISDIYFSSKLGLGDLKYDGSVSIPWDYNAALKMIVSIFKSILQLDKLIFFLGLLGMILAFPKNKYGNTFLLFSTIIYYVYMAGEAGRSTYYVWIPLVLSIYAGYAAVYFDEKVKAKFKFRQLLPLLILAAVFLSLPIIQDLVGQREQSLALVLREYALKNIPEDALVVVDPRIYRGLYTWIFNDKHYLEGTQFANLLTASSNIAGSVVVAPLYYIECGPGTNCGWRTEDFRRIYKTGEEISTLFHSVTEKVAEIKAGRDNILVYRGSIEFPNGIYEIIDRGHVSLYSSLGWKYPELGADYYETEGIGEKILHGFGFFMLYLSLLLALLTIPYVFYLLFKKKEEIISEKSQPFYTNHPTDKKNE